MGFNECKDCKKKICHKATRCKKCARIEVLRKDRIKNASKYTKQKK